MPHNIEVLKGDFWIVMAINCHISKKSFVADHAVCVYSDALVLTNKLFNNPDMRHIWRHRIAKYGIIQL